MTASSMGEFSFWYWAQLAGPMTRRSIRGRDPTLGRNSVQHRAHHCAHQLLDLIDLRRPPNRHLATQLVLQSSIVAVPVEVSLDLEMKKPQPLGRGFFHTRLFRIEADAPSIDRDVQCPSAAGFKGALDVPLL
jgi:hypothetical protein